MTAPKNDLGVVATALVHADTAPPAPAGFFGSDFAPLVQAAVHECLGDPRSAHLLTGAGDRTAIVLGSCRFDTTSLELSVDQVAGGRVSPILFYQVLPTAILGHLARAYGITGPVSCVAATGDARTEVLDTARLLLADDCADLVLGVTVELDPDPAKAFARADLVRSGERTQT
ncbi:beta-ketoacyl synthase N-terminal-like domain-containing protein [Streptomyces sp. ID05-26A]|nr:beta-ketoacyl synthase N-terminal-like domain-containing protein [Streptomyces sp. ID05-26A]